MSNPFLIPGPASISFSGGRTSAFMLWKVLEAHGGKLPDDVHVLFANTGREREETLRFVHECGSRWGVDIVWLEWRRQKPGFERVGFNSASRDGQPFADLIETKRRPPNWSQRYCTGILKVGAMQAYLRALGLAPDAYTSVIGLRHDEGHRVLRGRARALVDGIKVAYPLADARIVKADVMAFWAAQDFDLGLEPWQGNCDLCFLKGAAIRRRIIRDNPQVADWWAEQERLTGGWFDRKNRVAQLVADVAASPTLFDEPDDTPEYDAECGDVCGGDSPEEIALLQKIYEEQTR